MVNLIESLEEQYEYNRKNKEPFFVISVPIKDKHNITEALDEFCCEEKFVEGDKIFSDEHNTKIAVSKKMRFNSLPPTLILNLKRFEYDMKTFTRFKLNDFFEFSDEINLEKWLYHENQNQGNSTQYRLKGVLIHSGSAEAGHYYSYIRIKDQWIEFNDTGVRKFDPTDENKHKEWFGSGKTKSPEGGYGGYGSNSTSAYMLFYERVDKNDAEFDAEAKIALTESNLKMMSMIEEENRFFVRKKIFADSVSLRFLDSLLALLDKPEHLSRVESLMIDKESASISNPGLLDILVGRCVRISRAKLNMVVKHTA